ncbi:MAG: hypothetical protein A2Z34_03130 [Planctomycetes bacterium RBG_16_59_8]|nr:MAG: hypothetical protein A2Z34_03130 [Planctomycetes bacterium RBG_16_59_8]
MGDVRHAPKEGEPFFVSSVHMNMLRNAFIAVLIFLTAVDTALRAQDEGVIDALIRDLGDDDWDTREKAVEELVKIGKEALPRAEIASRSDDPEVAARAKRVVEWIKFNSIDGGGVVNGLQSILQSDNIQYNSGDPILLTLIVKNVSEGSRTITPVLGLDRKIEVPSKSESLSSSTSHGGLVVKCVSEAYVGLSSASIG